MTAPERPTRSTARTTPLVPISVRPLPIDLDDTVPTLSDELRSGPETPRPYDHASLTVLTGDRAGTLVPLGTHEVVVGRSTEAGVHLADASLSRRHARFFCVERQYYVADMGSTNGTFVAGVKIDAPVALRDGDQVQLGPNRVLRFNLDTAIGEAAAVQLHESSIRDPTSGAYNRRHFDARLETEKEYAERHAVPLTLLLIDLDGFKQVNDAHGHIFGDAVLRVVAASIQRLLKPEDTLVRYGGDEFVVLCRDTTIRNALILAERIRVHIAQLPFSASGNEFHVTVSVGIAGGRREESDWNALVETADRAMYAAKRSGRNAVVAP